MEIKNLNSNNRELTIRKGALVLYDIIAVYLAAFLALYVRFEFRIEGSVAEYMRRFHHYYFILVILALIVFSCMRMYSSLWTYAGINEMLNIAVACVIVSLLQIIAVTFITIAEGNMPRSYYVIYGIFLFALEFISRFAYRAIRSLMNHITEQKIKTNIMIVGAGNAGEMLMREIVNSCYVNKKVVCIIDDTPSKIGKYIHGVKVVGNRYAIPMAAKEFHVHEIMIAIPSASAQEIKGILDICKETGCELKRLPGMYQLVNGDVSVSKLKEVDVNDLLGREPVSVDISSIMGYVSNKTVLVTGGGGSIGSELCRQIAANSPKQLVIVDIYENTTYDIQNELRKKFPNLNLVVLIASVRNTKRMDLIFETYHPDIVYHAAAHKHVPLMEDSPNEAVKNNVLGTWKVVQAADKWKVKRFVMISTDKAVNPTNIMGASKRVCEMIIQTYNNRSQTEFVAVRFGNVLGSNGSVIPLFKKQIEQGGPVTVTHPDIIRYFMTIPEAVSLVLQAGAYAKGGEIFVLDMGEPVKILDLARNLILLSGHRPDEDIRIEFSGLRPGEKLYEELLMDEEGMQETKNRLIHIGKPIQLDEDHFLLQLENLRDYVVQEPEDIREWMKEIVPTYHPQ
ncbi:MAG: polysaccharide biosynthesis protein [Lachnospiraceae bacterium]|jgi:FlaA1/EpsC-like NDP-sugar epimerase|nr:polysaccharide biosynthesis protein [Lachnospiraceae bacterium]